MDDELTLVLTEEEDIELEIEESIVVRTTTDHSQLENLDYEHSGHSGFTRQVKVIYDNVNGKLQVQILDEQDNIIHTSNEIDLPVEHLVKDIKYYDQYTHEEITYNKVIVITMQNDEIRIVSLQNLINGLATETYVTDAVQVETERATQAEEELDERIDNIEGKKYSSLERLGAYLYKITFDRIPDINESITSNVPSGCSSFVRNGKLYRNLDWKYNENATFWVRTKNFEGLAFIDGLNDGNLDANKLSQLPYHMVDGRNEYGIRVSTHVLFNDWNYTGSGSKSVDITTIPFHILNEITNLNELNTKLLPYLNNLRIGEQILAAEYLVQFLVTDGTTTYAILPPTSESGNYSIVNITSNPKLTNFRCVNNEIVDRSSLQERPTGVERWNLIANESTTLETLKFTQAYESNERLSEFIGIDHTTKDSTDEELEEIYERARAIYLERTRDGVTWQTVHSVVYSANEIESLYVQENYNKNFVISGLDELDTKINNEINRATAKETSLESAINNEISNRQASEQVINGNIETLAEGLSDAEQDIQEIKNELDSGVVHSVNSKTGDVELNAQDIKLTTNQQTIQANIIRIDEEINRVEQEITDKIDENVNIKSTAQFFTVSGDTVTFTLQYKVLSTGATESKSETLPLATSTAAGLMPPSSVTALQQLRQEVDALEGQNIRLSYTIKDNPTANEIAMFVIASGYQDTTKWSTIGVVVKNTNHIWRYYTNTNAWADIGLDTVNQFTNSIAGIIKGSETDGQVYAEDDGTGSVNGWSALKQRVTTVENNKANKSDLGTLAEKDSVDYETEVTNKPTIPSGDSLVSANDRTNWNGKANNSDLTNHTSNTTIHVTASDKVAWSQKQNAITNENKLSASLVEGLKAVATSNNYNDLDNKPTIPTRTSQLTNDSGFITSAPNEIFICTYGTTSGNDISQALAQNKLPIVRMTNGDVAVYYQTASKYYFHYILKEGGDIHTYRVACSLTGSTWATEEVTLEKVGNKKTSISSSSTNVQYPSAKAVYDFVNGQLPSSDQLVSSSDRTNWNGKLNKPTSAIGSNNKPVYIDDNGVITAGSQYAGGTLVAVNGSAKTGSTAVFYAPITYGTSGQLVQSNGKTQALTYTSNPQIDTIKIGGHWTLSTDENGNLTFTYS